MAGYLATAGGPAARWNTPAGSCALWLRICTDYLKEKPDFVFCVTGRIKQVCTSLLVVFFCYISVVVNDLKCNEERKKRQIWRTRTNVFCDIEETSKLFYTTPNLNTSKIFICMFAAPFLLLFFIWFFWFFWELTALQVRRDYTEIIFSMNVSSDERQWLSLSELWGCLNSSLHWSYAAAVRGALFCSDKLTPLNWSHRCLAN